jgi:TP901 family phage tail tape measure protein
VPPGLTQKLAIVIDAIGARAFGTFDKLTHHTNTQTAAQERLNKATAKYAIIPSQANLDAKNNAAAAVATAQAAKRVEQTKLLGKAALATGAAGLAGFGLMTKAAVDFDRAMAQVNAVVGEAEKGRLPELRKAALSAGKDFGFMAGEVAGAQAELVKAGVSVEDILAGGLTGALSLAAAGELSVGEAATVAVQAMNAFGLAGKDVTHIADVLAAGANKSATDVHNIGQSLGQTAVVAKRFGLSLEETVGSIALFAQNGFEGSDAGTSFKLMLSRLTPVSTEAGRVFEQYFGDNSPFYDAQGNFIGLIPTIEKLQDAFGGLTAQERDAAIQAAFGVDAQRAVSIAIEEGAAGWRDFVAGVDDAGAAGRVAGDRLDSLSGDVRKLKSELNEAFIDAGGAGIEVFRGLAQAATGLIGAFNGLPGPVKTVAGGLLGVVATLTALGGAVAILKPRLQAASAGLASMGKSGALASKALGPLSKLLKGGFVATAAITGVVALHGAIKNMVLDTADVDKLGLALRDLNVNNEFGGELLKFGDNIDEMYEKIKNATNNLFNEGPQGLLGFGDGDEAKKLIKSIDEAFAGLEASGNGAVAERLITDLGEAAAKEGGNIDFFTSRLHKYEAAQKETAISAKEAKNGVTGLAGGIEDVGDAAAEAEDPVRKLEDSIIGTINAERAYAAAQRSVAAAGRDLNDARRELNELLAEGAVDQEEVAQSLDALTSAQERYADALETVNDAQEAVNEALVPLTSKELERFTVGIAQAHLGLADAIDTAEDAAIRLHEALNPKSADPLDIAEARQEVTDAFEDWQKVSGDYRSTPGEIADAENRWNRAQQDLNGLLEQGKIDIEEVDDAQRALDSALLGVTTATWGVEDAQSAHNEALKIGTTDSEEYKTAVDGLKDANVGLAAATKDVTSATTDYHTALAGDPEFNDKVRDARQGVADATNNLDDAQWDATQTALGLKRAVEDEQAAFDKLGTSIGAVKQNLTDLKAEFPEVAGGVDEIFKALGGLVAKIGDAALTNRAPLVGNTAGGLGGLLRGLQPYPMSGLPGLSGLADGGVVMPTPGGRLFNVGEAGQPEAVIPLDRFGSSFGGGMNININVGGSVISERDLVELVRSEFYKIQKRNAGRLGFN